MITKIEIREALPSDFKIDDRTLRIGQPFIILDEDLEHVIIHDYIKPSLDQYKFKWFLDHNRVYVPTYNYSMDRFLDSTTDFNPEKYELQLQRNKANT